MPNGEAFVWPEGQVSLYTGNLATSAVIAFAQNTRMGFAKGFVNAETLAGTYYDYKTGQRVDVTIGAVWCFDNTIARLFDSGTAVHMKIINSGVNGSAGYMLYSGCIDSLPYDGTENAPFKYTLTYHANVWSGF